MNANKGVLVKRLALVLIMVALISPPVYAGDLQEGIDAARRGDYKTASEKLMPLAEKGDAEAQRNIGFMYYQGHGVAKNYDEAVNWYLKSARQGNAGAQTSLGTMYYQGHGVPKNYQEAIRWFRLAAKNNEPMAQAKLGMMLYGGQGVTQNFKEAARWAHLSAEQNDSSGQILLARLYMEGKGVTKNYIHSLKWFYLADMNGRKKVRPAIDVLLKELSKQHVSEAQTLVKEWLKIRK